MRARPAFRAFLAVLGVLSGVSPAVAAGAEVFRHDLQIAVDPAKGRLQGSAELTIRTLGQPAVELRLAQGLELREVLQIDRDGTARPLSLSGAYLPAPTDGRPLASSDPLAQLRVRRATLLPGTPLETVLRVVWDGALKGIGRDGVWLAQTAGWYPSAAQATSRFRIRAELPAGWVLATPTELPGPLEGLALLAGGWEVVGTGERIVVYRRRGTAEAVARGWLAEARAALAVAERQSGPLPWPELRLVETGIELAAGPLPGLVPLARPDRASIARGVTRQWWGAGVFATPGSGWATALVDYLVGLEPLAEPAARQLRLEWLRSAPDPRGPFFFHMLRRRLGDERFTVGLRTFFGEFRQRRAGWDDLERSLAAATREPLRAFFRQWIERGTLPKVEFAFPATAIRQTEAGPVLDLRLFVEGDWDLDIPFEVRRAGLPAVRGIWRSGGGRAPDAIPLAAWSGTGSVAVDPEADLLRELPPRERPPTFGRLLDARPFLVVVGTARSDEVDRDAAAWARTLGATRLLDDGAAKATDIERAPTVWIVGRPRAGTPAAQAVAGRLPEGLRLEEAALGFGEVQVEGAVAGIAAVVDHPEPGKGLLGFVDVLAPEGFRELRARLEAVRMRSIVLFDGGGVRFDATAAPPSPLVVGFEVGPR